MNPFRTLKNRFSPSTPLSHDTSITSPSMTSDMGSNTTSNLTVIELFQSQSCSSCPPANAHLLKTIPRNSPDTLLLTYEVTYWNHLSWVDTFSDPRWDKRQRDYVRAMGLRSPFTPQVFVDGGARVLEGGWWNIDKLFGSRRSVGKGFVEVKILDLSSRRGKAIEIDGSETSRASVQVVWYEVDTAPVNVLRGENRGVTIPHRNVVRDLQVIGVLEGNNRTFELPAKRVGLEMAVLVQKESNGHIIGAVRV